MALKVDHKEAQVGGDQYRLNGGEKVLWYFADFGRSDNTGKELALDAPRQVRANEPFSVRATAYDAQANESPAAGVRITGGATPAITGANGRTMLTASREDTIALRGTRTPDIPAAPVKVRVTSDSPSSQSPTEGGHNETGSRGGSASGGGSRSGGRSGSDSSGGSGGRSRFGGTSQAGGGNVAENKASYSPTTSLYRGDGDGDSKALQSPASAEVRNGHPLGELLSGPGEEIPPKPNSSSRPPSSAGGVPLVALVVALGALMLTPVGGFLARTVLRARWSRSSASADGG